MFNSAHVMLYGVNILVQFSNDFDFSVYMDVDMRFFGFNVGFMINL